MAPWLRSKTILRPLLAVILAGATGCSASPAAKMLTPPADTANPANAGHAALIDACALFTAADAEQILGDPVDDATHPLSGSELFTVTSCKYRVREGNALENATIIVTVPADGDKAAARTAFEIGKKQAPDMYGASPVEIPGIGDSAYWVSGSGNNLSVLAGAINVMLSVYTQKGAVPSPALLTLAKLIVSRLP
jgi:hypothetical protein